MLPLIVVGTGSHTLPWCIFQCTILPLYDRAWFFMVFIDKKSIMSEPSQLKEGPRFASLWSFRGQPHVMVLSLGEGCKGVRVRRRPSSACRQSSEPRLHSLILLMHLHSYSRLDYTIHSMSPVLCHVGFPGRYWRDNFSSLGSYELQVSVQFTGT